MASNDEKQGRRVDRRTFLRRGLIAGGAVAGAGIAIRAMADASSDSAAATAPAPSPKPQGVPIGRTTPSDVLSEGAQHPRDRRRPAALPPVGLGRAPSARPSPPTCRGCAKDAVSFGHHYTASNDCTPARSTLLTGLYTHQTGCMITGGSTLDPGFPTWGTMLREHGYHTHWFGKWHLTHRDNRWTPLTGSAALEEYGFARRRVPVPRRRPRAGLEAGPPHRRRVRASGSGTPTTSSRGARRCRS